jgi:alcohol dehydrogenase YqhD (iron-dependent ADH family)
VIDSAKAIAVGVPHAGDVWDFFLKRATASAGVPIGVVLTIPAVLSPRTCRRASRASRFRAPSSLVITDPKLLSLPAHGAWLAVVFPASMKRVFRHDVARFAQFAERVWDVDHDFADPARTELEGIRSMEVFREIGLPVTLEELGSGTTATRRWRANGRSAIRWATS